MVAGPTTPRVEPLVVIVPVVSEYGLAVSEEDAFEEAEDIVEDVEDAEAAPRIALSKLPRSVEVAAPLPDDDDDDDVVSRLIACGVGMDELDELDASKVCEPVSVLIITTGVSATVCVVGITTELVTGICVLVG